MCGTCGRAGARRSSNHGQAEAEAPSPVHAPAALSEAAPGTGGRDGLSMTDPARGWEAEAAAHTLEECPHEGHNFVPGACFACEVAALQAAFDAGVDAGVAQERARWKNAVRNSDIAKAAEPE